MILQFHFISMYIIRVITDVLTNVKNGNSCTFGHQNKTKHIMSYRGLLNFCSIKGSLLKNMKTGKQIHGNQRKPVSIQSTIKYTGLLSLLHLIEDKQIGDVIALS